MLLCGLSETSTAASYMTLGTLEPFPYAAQTQPHAGGKDTSPHARFPGRIDLPSNHDALRATATSGTDCDAAAMIGPIMPAAARPITSTVKPMPKKMFWRMVR